MGDGMICVYNVVAELGGRRNERLLYNGNAIPKINWISSENSLFYSEI